MVRRRLPTKPDEGAGINKISETRRTLRKSAKTRLARPLMAAAPSRANVLGLTVIATKTRPTSAPLIWAVELKNEAQASAWMANVMGALSLAAYGVYLRG